jgi:glycerophosphoryl diester phosphodiesterase
VHNPWLERRVICYAHQGGAAEAPSSTLFAMQRALDVGASALELDVHQSLDGVLVVCHDATLDRTSSLTGAIADHTAADLAEGDNAYWFVPGEGAVAGLPVEAYPYRGLAPRDSRFGVATLAAVLEAFPGVLLNLDIKQGAPQVAPYEAALAAMLQAAGRSDDVIVASFNDASTRAFHELAPEIGTSPGISALTQVVQAIRRGEGPPRALLAGAVALQVPSRVGGTWLVDERLVEATHDLGLALHVWTVDDPKEMAELVDLGVDGIMTDVPSELASLLKRRGVALGRASGS